ncbi:3-keto-5-aminohexanoate cleavage protein [Actinomadura citrea]|uniref:Uncharacterized protein (DUF849 family) n=1 Tax=Actinomadura citrea TaxID=46158 RepID=A0A7Y9GFH4_9ACTN|nr:3-keto-5-aminohexanoate cleavage protein [Actinomadura citrea]NYE15567.1 uncharacterized protein (DUF849 family) [Actinomadura citrea]GGT65706.1 3-keto-5-aminohexanoate cleavage protein [Actinomadura citrea]
MLRDKYEPCVLTAAVTGGDVLPSQSPHIPCGPEAIIEEAVGAAEAGATCVHLHAREPDGRPSGDPALFRDIVAGIRERSGVVINISTGGTPGMPEEQRLAGIRACRPEIGTLNLGTMNYEGFPNRARWPKVRHAWEQEVLDKSGEGVFTNTLGTIRRFAAEFRDLGVTPELEAYDLGHLSMVRFLLDEGTLEGPVRIQLVLGVLGGAGNALDDFFTLSQAAARILGPDAASLSVAATGFPGEFRHVATALSWGADCRVGLEDNIRVRRDRQAESNAELVRVATDLADLLARPIATPDALRSELGPWYKAT